MSSINLLPKKMRFKENKEKQRRIFFAFSVLLLIISVISYLGVYIEKTIASDKSEKLNLEMKKVSTDIEKEMENNKLLLTKNGIKDITKILNDHNYFSKAFSVIQNIVTDDICLEESNLSFNKDENLVMEVSGTADNYSAVVNQIAIFKNSYWIDNVEIESISYEEKDGDIVFSGNLKFKREVISFHENYWDSGLLLLSLKVDRYLSIDSYSAELKEMPDSNENFVQVSFSGIAYDAKKLIPLENDLKQMDAFIKSASVTYDLNKKNDNNTIDFSGEMKLNIL